MERMDFSFTREGASEGNLAQSLVDRYNEMEGNKNEQDGYDCSICKNKEYVAKINADGDMVQVYCKCHKAREMLRKAQNSGLGNIIKDFSFDKFETTESWQKENKQFAMDFCKDEDAKWFFIGGQCGCVDCDTEYFNGKSWVKISEYNPEDKVLQYDPESKTATLVKPQRYIVKPAEKLYKLETKRHHIDMCLSEDHSFAYITTKGHMQKKTFSEVIEMHNNTIQGFYGKIETTFNYAGKGIDLTDNEIRLMCAVMADGCFRDKVNFCDVNVKKERKKIRMRTLLEGVPFKEYKCQNGYSIFRFYAPRREKEFSEYWYNCNQHQLQIIAKEIFEWDGSTRDNRETYFSTSKKSADFIQFVLSATGSRATISKDERKDKVCYTVIKSQGKSLVSICSTKGEHKATIKEIVPKDKKQYCFTVDKGYLVLRRNGRIFITGNCGKSHLCTAICAHYIKQGKDTVYMIWMEDSIKLKALRNEYEEYQNIMQKFKEAEVLYIDDFLKVRNGEEPTNGDINVAFELLNHRLLSKDKITIISSEKTMHDLLMYDQATMSRVYQKAGKYKINIKSDINKNYRLKD